jgi:perosamine synthetase
MQEKWKNYTKSYYRRDNMAWKIPLFKIYCDDKDVEGVTRVIKRGSYWATGPEIQEFEKALSKYVGTQYAVAVNSGTSALHAVLQATLQQGDEVIVPSFTFVATANAPLFVGARPVFADIEEKTYGLDPEDVKEKITPKTKAIICVHYGGCPCFVKELKDIAEANNLVLIEDAAEALGATVKSEPVGTFGDAAVLSFCQNKVITTGEGGAVVTDSRELYEKMILTRSHGRLDHDYFSSVEHSDYITLGYNFRMSSLTAALGVSQIKKIDDIIQIRREKAHYMTENLSGIEGVRVPDPPHSYYHVYQLYTIRVLTQRNELMHYLADKGIMTKVYFDPIHFMSFYRDLNYTVELPVTERVASQVVSLPLYPTLQDTEIDYITSEITNFMVRT